MLQATSQEQENAQWQKISNSPDSEGLRVEIETSAPNVQSFLSSSPAAHGGLTAENSCWVLALCAPLLQLPALFWCSSTEDESDFFERESRILRDFSRETKCAFFEGRSRKVTRSIRSKNVKDTWKVFASTTNREQKRCSTLKKDKNFAKIS